MDNVKKTSVEILNEQLIENYKATRALHQSIISMQGNLHADNEKLVKRIEALEQKIDKLSNNKDLVNNQGCLKKDWRDYTDEEIYNLRYSTSLRKAADRLGCSKSTIQRICRKVKNNSDEIID